MRLRSAFVSYPSPHQYHQPGPPPKRSDRWLYTLVIVLGLGIGVVAVLAFVGLPDDETTAGPTTATAVDPSTNAAGTATTAAASEPTATTGGTDTTLAAVITETTLAGIPPLELDATGCPVIANADTITCYDIDGTTVQELRESINTNRSFVDPNDGGRFDAGVLYTYSWNWNGYGTDSCDLSTAVVDADIDVWLPRWNAPADADPALVQRWTVYLTNLTAHEANHVGNAHQGETVIADAIRSSACADADAAALAALSRVTAFDAAYDGRTGHGATEGASFP